MRLILKWPVYFYVGHVQFFSSNLKGLLILVTNLTAGIVPVAAGLLGATRRTETGLRVLGIGLAAAELHAFSVGAEAVAVLAADVGGKA